MNSTAATKPLPSFTEVGRIVKQHGGSTYGKVLGCAHASLAIPVPAFNGLQIAIFFARTSSGPESTGTWIEAPSFVVQLRADTGTFVELRAVEPSSFGLEGKPGALLGEIAWPPNEDQMRPLLSLYDKILPWFVAGFPQLSPDTKRDMNEFKALFTKMAEPPLVPYYRALGTRFFSWLDQAGNEGA